MENPNHRYTLLGLLLILVLALPYTPHSTGSDSFFFQKLSSSLVNDQTAKWVRNPLSFIGLNSYSYPSTIMYLTAEMMVVTGLDVEQTTIAISLALILCSFLGMYLLSSSFSHDFHYRLFSSFFIASSPLVLRWGTFTLSSRLLFIVVLLYSLYFISRILAHPHPRFSLPLAILLLLFSATAHRMFSIAFVQLAVVSVFFTCLIRYVKTQAFQYSFNYILLLCLVLASLLCVWGVWKPPNTNEYELYPDFITRLIHLTFVYIRDIGVISVLLPLGILTPLSKGKPFTLFTYLSISFLSIFIVSWYYILPILLPLIILVSTAGLFSLPHAVAKTVSRLKILVPASTTRAFSNYLIQLVILSSIGFSIFGQFYHFQADSLGLSTHLTPDRFALIHFIDSEVEGRVAGQSNYLTEIDGISVKQFLPIINEPLILAYGILDKNQVQESFVFLHDGNGRRIFSSQDTQSVVYADTAAFLRTLDPSIMDKYDLDCVLLEKGQILPYPPVYSIGEKIFDNGGHSLYYVPTSQS